MRRELCQKKSKGSLFFGSYNVHGAMAKITFVKLCFFKTAPFLVVTKEIQFTGRGLIVITNQDVLPRLC